MTVLRLQLASYQPKTTGEGKGEGKTRRTSEHASFPFVFSLTAPRVLSREEGLGNDNVDRAGTGPEVPGRSSRSNSAEVPFSFRKVREKVTVAHFVII